jgi:hypothetical protein
MQAYLDVPQAATKWFIGQDMVRRTNAPQCHRPVVDLAAALGEVVWVRHLPPNRVYLINSLR